MQIVIDIPENIYDAIMDDEMISREQLAVLEKHIYYGTPLPKGHGAIKDVSQIEIPMCEDAISRQAVLEIIEREEFKGDAISEIEKLPPITPQPKIGRWIADVDRWGDIVTTVNGYRCSECNAFNTDKDNFCPNCGAKMIEPQESEEEE